MNDIKFKIVAFNDEDVIYNSTLPDTASVETVLALNDEMFDENTLFKLTAFVDGNVVYDSHKFSKDNLDMYFETAEVTVEEVIE